MKYSELEKKITRLQEINDYLCDELLILRTRVTKDVLVTDETREFDRAGTEAYDE